MFVAAGKLVVFGKELFVIKNVKTEAFEPLLRRLDFSTGNLAGGGGQRDSVTG
jgi:hypothetical protein